MDLVFGALTPKLHEQLKLPRRQLRYFQECADSITTLSVGRLLSDAEKHRARKRLVKRIRDTFFKAAGLAPTQEKPTEKAS